MPKLKPLTIFPIAALIVALAWLAPGCDDAATVPEAADSITGTVDGTPFTATNVRAFRDTNDVFNITGRILGDVRFSIYYVNETAQNHPVQTEGNFLEFIDVLDSLYNVEPPITDSLVLDSLADGLAELLSSADNPLAPDKSFGFYIIGNSIYFSENGNVEITAFSRDPNRLSGNLDMGLVNFFGGRKDWNAVLEDIEFFE